MTRAGYDMLIAGLTATATYALVAWGMIEVGMPPRLVALIMALSTLYAGGAVIIGVRNRHGLPTISMEVFIRVALLSTVALAASVGGTLLGMQGHLAGVFGCSVVAAGRTED